MPSPPPSPPHLSRKKNPPVPLLIHAFPSPPNHIPASPRLSTSSLNPPPSLPPCAPLPPVPGPSPLTDQETILIMSSSLSSRRRSSKLSSDPPSSSSGNSSPHTSTTLPQSTPSGRESTSPPNGTRRESIISVRSTRSYSNASLRAPTPNFSRPTHLIAHPTSPTHLSDIDDDEPPPAAQTSPRIPRGRTDPKPTPTPTPTEDPDPRAPSPDILSIISSTPRSKPKHPHPHPHSHPSSTSTTPKRTSSFYSDTSSLSSHSPSLSLSRSHSRRITHSTAPPVSFRMRTISGKKDRDRDRDSTNAIEGGNRESWDDGFIDDEDIIDPEIEVGALPAHEHHQGEIEPDPGSDSDSSLDLHTPLPHLMLRHGLLSPHSKLLPPSSTSSTTDRSPSPSDGRPDSIFSVASNVTKSGILKDERDTPKRRVRHRDGKLLRGGIGLTTGLGWSDSEDEDAPSALTRRISTLNLSRRRTTKPALTRSYSSTSLRQPQPQPQPRTRASLPPRTTTKDARTSSSSSSTPPLPITPKEGERVLSPVSRDKMLPPLPPSASSSGRKYPSTLTLKTSPGPGSFSIPRPRAYSGSNASSSSSTPIPAPGPVQPKTPTTPRTLLLPQVQQQQSQTQPGAKLAFNRKLYDQQRQRTTSGVRPSDPRRLLPPPVSVKGTGKPRTGAGMVYRNTSGGSAGQAQVLARARMQERGTGVVPQAIAL